jgi:hypothetical protein
MIKIYSYFFELLEYSADAHQLVLPDLVVHRDYVKLLLNP